MTEKLTLSYWFDDNYPRRRFIIAGFMVSLLFVYYPVNLFNIGRGIVAPRIEWIDGNIPLIPIFAAPYLLSGALMIILPFLGALVLPGRLFKQYSLALTTAILSNYIIWLMLPAYIAKQVYVGEASFFADTIRNMHDPVINYGIHNAIPSSHISYITLPMLYFIQWKRKIGIVYIPYAVINALSTMYTHQHYFLDVIAGFVLTWFVYDFGRLLYLQFIRQIKARKIQQYQPKKRMKKANIPSQGYS